MEPETSIRVTLDGPDKDGFYVATAHLTEDHRFTGTSRNKVSAAGYALEAVGQHLVGSSKELRYPRVAFLGRCNGYRPDAKLSPEAEAEVKAVLPDARKFFEAYMTANPDEHLERGRRYLDDSDVFRRIASAGRTEEIVSSPFAWAADSLRECASADYYYTHEKQW